jgi:transposase
MAGTTIAVDLAKSVFEAAVSDRPGRTKERHRLTRSHFLEFFVDRPPSTVVLEACSSAHHWGRKIRNSSLKPVSLRAGAGSVGSRGDFSSGGCGAG